MSLKTHAAQPVYTLRAKLRKVLMKCENVNFLKCALLMLHNFFLPFTYPVNSFF